VVERTERPSCTAAAVCVCTVPKAPKSTFAIERFIARPISIVSRVPDAPTSAPLTISTVLWSTKPVADAARPVHALSSEITTGMSAPPIGSTNRTPNASAPASSATRSASSCGPTTMATPRPTIPASSAALTIFWAG
jgi:hypothetical protein